jgi:hypothetical protein
MIRISKQQLAERWALTYSQDGFDVRAASVPGRTPPQRISGILPDLEAIRGNERVLVHIIASPESLDDGETRAELQTLAQARAQGAQLHVVVAAECAYQIKQLFDEWHVHADTIHIT